MFSYLFGKKVAKSSNSSNNNSKNSSHSNDETPYAITKKSNFGAPSIIDDYNPTQSNSRQDDIDPIQDKISAINLKDYLKDDYQISDVVDVDSTWGVLAISPAKTRCVKNLNEYEHKKNKATKTSAHPVFPIKKSNGLNYFFKIIDKPIMSYMEAYANHRYRMMLPGKVAPNKAYLDHNDDPVGICSKAIPNFVTLKDILKKFILSEKNETLGINKYINWFKEYLENDKNRRRFIEILAVAFYRCEDDLHGGNIAINLETGELFLFDTDCSMWPLMHKFKGGRAGVDGYNRNPVTDFDLSLEDIRHFPNLKTAKLHYFPGRNPHFVANIMTKPIVKNHTDNLYLDEIIQIVQTLDSSSSNAHCPEILEICFNVWLKEMLCGTEMTEAIANLHIPKNYAHADKNLIKDILEYETKRNNEFLNKLPGMPQFYSYLKTNKESILYDCLLNCAQRNQKFMNSASKHPERAKEYMAAVFPLEKLIENFNELIKRSNYACIAEFSCYFEQSNLIGLDQIDPVDTATILKKFETQLALDLEERKSQYDNWINRGKTRS